MSEKTTTSTSATTQSHGPHHGFRTFLYTVQTLLFIGIVGALIAIAVELQKVTSGDALKVVASQALPVQGTMTVNIGSRAGQTITAVVTTVGAVPTIAFRMSTETSSANLMKLNVTINLVKLQIRVGERLVFAEDFRERDLVRDLVN
ncbi:hypothetical protein BDQ12DRAFT_712375 [Crucibulum laeve]|uniref:Uncharacterized protein n=1 Tax=Crucibulum laeve TaxID=68775 RepID=A0A5C3M3V9_9AGAR|nr:hypothetical protein BDQ12DRAFT_712375 [Crucibulum laeve]